MTEFSFLGELSLQQELIYTAWSNKVTNKQILNILEFNHYCSDWCFLHVVCLAMIILSLTDAVCSFLFLKLPCKKYSCPYSRMTMMRFIRLNLWEIGHDRVLNLTLLKVFRMCWSWLYTAWHLQTLIFNWAAYSCHNIVNSLWHCFNNIRKHLFPSRVAFIFGQDLVMTMGESNNSI